ncbi:MAG: hypothetical protein LWW94_01340 [Candidatus Desulfofervidaceae bacterium]|nr:hypothetical protein [Candidatus Desulfofervidaceae bacterium]
MAEEEYDKEGHSDAFHEEFIKAMEEWAEKRKALAEDRADLANKRTE